MIPCSIRRQRVRSLVSRRRHFGGRGVRGCAPSVEQRGNLPNADKMAEIHAGSTTKDEVAKMLGTPSSVSVFNNDKSWYYISRRTSQTAFFEPDVLDQQVYIVDFDDQGVVKAVDHKVLQDGEEITPVARATPAPGRELSFLEQLIGNLGKFNSSGGAAAAAASGGGRPAARTAQRRAEGPRGTGRPRSARCHLARIASSNSATILVILIIGLTAGPAVSL